MGVAPCLRGFGHVANHVVDTETRIIINQVAGTVGEELGWNIGADC